MQRILFGQRDEWRRWAEKVLDPAAYQFALGDLRDPGFCFADYDAVIPLRLHEYAPLRRLRNPRDNFLIPDETTVKLADDKLTLNAFLVARGFAGFVPPVYDGEVRYPFIYKKRIDAAGANSRIMYSPDDLPEFERGKNLARYFRQEYTPGKVEYTTHMIAVAGGVTYETTLEFTFDTDHYVRGKLCHDPVARRIETPFLDTFCAVVEALGYTGACCINYKIENGIPRIFEVNPRGGGTLFLDLKAFVDAYLAALELRRSARPPAPAPVLAAEQPAQPLP